MHIMLVKLVMSSSIDLKLDLQLCFDLRLLA